MSCGEIDQKMNEYIAKLLDMDFASEAEGEAIAKEVETFCDESDDQYLVGNGLFALAEYTFAKEENLDKVFDYCLRAIPYLERAEDYFGLSRNYNTLAIHYYLRGYMTGAMENFLKSLSFNKRVSDEQRREGVQLSNIATVFHAMGAYDTALEYELKAIPLLMKDDGSRHWARNLTLAATMTGLLYIEYEEDPLEAEFYRAVAFDTLQNHIASEEEKPYNEYWLLCAKMARFEGNTEAFNEALECIITKAATKGIHGEESDAIANILDYLTKLEEWELFKRLSDLYEGIVSELPSGYQARFYSDKLQWARACSTRQEQAELALLYYDAATEQNQMYRDAELNSIREKKAMDEMRRENKRLSEMAETDQLTGLPNRYRLNRYSDKLFEKAYADKTSLAVSIIDIDYFKQYNDTLGHQAGDECIRAISDVLRKFVETHENTFAARYGGDEFVLLYAGLNDDQLLAYADELRESVKTLAIPHPATPSGLVSITQGIRNSVPNVKNKLWDYMFAADNALYEAKKEHNGQVVLLKKALISQTALDQAQVF